MNTAAGLGPAEGRFVAEAVDVNVTPKGIHLAASIEARLQTFQPQDAVDDGRIRVSVPLQSNWLSTSEDCADERAAANFPGNAMEAQWSSF